MPEIKTRETHRDTIRTLDRSVAMLRHIRDVRAKTKERIEETYTEKDANVSTNATEKMQTAAKKAIISTVINSRETAKVVVENNGTARILPERDPLPSMGSDVSSLVGNKEGNDTVRKMPHGRVRRSGRRDVGMRTAGMNSAGRFGAAVSVKRYEKEKAISKRQYQMAGQANAAVRKTREAAQHVRGKLRNVISGKRLRKLALSIGGSAAILIITVFVFFGSAFFFTGGDNVAAENTAIIRVAQAQIGNVGGEKYWRWFGYHHHVHWCAIFVSWCADQCGYIESGTAPKFGGIDTGINWFKKHKQWVGRNYVPKAGDYIFFDWESDGVPDHVGFVESCDGKTITTVEGNRSDVCGKATYTVGEAPIYGFGVPKYKKAKKKDEG